jgi:predicted nucleic acid-binding protein
MNGRIARYVLLDTGFWRGLLNPADPMHAQAQRVYEVVEPCYVLVPWPTLYEFLNTAFTKRRAHVVALAAALRSPGIRRIDDEQYKRRALDEYLGERGEKRPMSLVDRVVRLMAEDVNLRVAAIATFNPGDFHDVCRDRGLEMLCG